MSDRDPTAPDRKRRQRQRERDGLVSFRLALPGDASIAAVINAGLITDLAALRHEAVEQALEIFLAPYILCHAVPVPSASGEAKKHHKEKKSCLTESLPR